MKITFIRPSLVVGKPKDSLEPLVFGILSSLTPPDIDRVLYDDRVEEVPFDEPTDLVALSVETYTARRAYQIAMEYRQRGVPVVMGGVHPTLMPDEAAQFADAVVVGDAEGVWGQLVDDARSRGLKPRYESRFPSLEGLKVDRSIFAGKRYVKVPLVQFGRGCRFACDFCSIKSFYGNNVRHRPVSEVAAEIGALGRKQVFFTDDNLFNDAETGKELCRALTPLRVRWGCQCSLDVAADAELMSLMRDSGCMCALVGFESLEDGTLTQMRKGWHRRHGDYLDLVKAFRDHGIMVWGSFVLGYDHDTLDSFDRAAEFALRAKLFLCNFNLLNPNPGAPVYERLLDEGRMLYEKWWLHPDYRFGRAPFKPALMTPSELSEGCFHTRRRFNALSGIFSRSLDLAANLKSPRNAALFLFANLAARGEIHRKQGQPLGDPNGPELPLSS